jgi:alkylation response protein AidB-like acyl-CoA dehydrogenase
MLPPQEHMRMLKDRAAGIASPQEALNRSRALRFTEPGFDRTVWRQMCGKGWLGLCVPVESGGLGRGVRPLCRVAEDLGSALAPEPVVPAAMAAALLPAAHLPPVLSGERIVLPAWQEAPGSLALAGATTLRDGLLTGQKLSVPMACGADAFLVTLANGLALVERGAPGLTMVVQPQPDGGHVATLSFDNAPATALADGAASGLDETAANALDQAIVATAAYLVGLMRGAMRTDPAAPAQAGTETARRFAADMQTQLALTEAAVRAAAAAVDSERRGTARQTAVSRALLRARDAALMVTRTAAQLHAGTGARDAAWFMRRAAMLAAQYGSGSAHRARCRATGA